ncbi:MAG: MBL fold metallo-hydrolase, partial [Pirellulales bacterium]|nr:MBL fold metallo-hydrolase [Pirellulales bacterium]
GDLGQRGKPIIRDPALLAEADYILLESTYGNRDHNGPADVEQRLAEVIRETAAGGGNIVIPVFALERAQELLYHIGCLLRDRKIPPIDVVLNSPMAVDITEVFRRHRDCFDTEAWDRINSGESLFRFPGARMVRSVEESKQIHQTPRPSIIMATSGMCTAGRIKHHLRHNITRPESTILFVGYQAQGTLGRKIADGNAEVRILGSIYPVRARIAQIDGFSGHADRSGLCGWLEAFASPPRRLFLVHGEEQGSLELAERVRHDRGWNVCVPKYQDKVLLD